MNPILIDVPMPIRTPRLLIKPREIGEGKVLNAAVCKSIDFLSAWLPFVKTMPTLDESEIHCRRSLADFILRQNIVLSIYTLDGQILIGSTGLHRIDWSVPSLEIGYWICEEHQGKGYITEAVNALTRYAFAALRARRVEIRCDAKNVKSHAVILRLGFEQEGLLKADSVSESGILRNTIICARQDISGLPDLRVSWGT